MSVQVVILPGLLCDSRMFAAQVRAFDAIVVDGFYGDANRLEAMASYALDLLPDRFALLGHSMGGRVALEIWRRAPERVERLALADTGVHPVREGEADKRLPLCELGRNAGGEALVAAWLPPMIGQAHRDDPALYETLRAMAVDAGAATFARQTSALLNRPPVDVVLPTLRCPTFAIVGSDDQWSPVAQHREIVAAVPGAELRVVEGAGHMAPTEEPERFNTIMREWLTWPARDYQQAI